MRPEPTRLTFVIGERVKWVCRGMKKFGTVRLIVPPGENPRRVLDRHFGTHKYFHAFRTNLGVVVRLYETYLVEADPSCRSRPDRAMCWQSGSTLQRNAG